MLFFYDVEKRGKGFSYASVFEFTANFSPANCVFTVDKVNLMSGTDALFKFTMT